MISIRMVVASAGGGVDTGPRTVSFNSSFINSYIPNAGFSGVETITYTIRDSEGLTATGTLTVWVDTGSASAAQSPNPQTDYFYVYQGSSVGFTTAQLLDNDVDPNGQALTVVAVSEPANNGTLTGNLTDGFDVHAWQRGGAGGHRHRTQLPRHRHRRSRHPGEHHHPHPRRRRHQLGRRWLVVMWRGRMRGSRRGRCSCSAMISIRTVVASAWWRCRRRPTVPCRSTAAYINSYIPNAGFSGVETITYTIRDSEGLTATGTLTVWVDTGSASAAESPNPQTDYFYVYQGSSVGFTTAQLLDNDVDPNGQVLTVVAVSEPANNGTLTGNLTDGFAYTPGNAAALVGTDIGLNYLVTDTDGHVTQENITIRILAAGDTNRPPVARGDVARTNAGDSTGRCSCSAMISIPTVVPSPWWRCRRRPTVRCRSTAAYINSYIPNAGFSGVETITYTIRDSEGLTATGTLTVWVDTGSASAAQSPNPQTDYFYVYQGSSVGFTTAQLLDNDVDPNGQVLTVVAVSEPANNGTLTGNLTDGFAYTPGNAAALVGTDIGLNYLVTDTDGHVTQENITIRILAAGDTNRPPVAVPDTAADECGGLDGGAVRARE